VTDATLIGALVDGTVLCLQAGRVRREDIKACRERLQLAGVKLLGGVLNRYHEVGGRYRKYYYHHYEAYGEQTMDSKADSAA
jgi:Mrp family chromosome partitioning ATPase